MKEVQGGIFPPGRERAERYCIPIRKEGLWIHRWEAWKSRSGFLFFFFFSSKCVVRLVRGGHGAAWVVMKDRKKDVSEPCSSGSQGTPMCQTLIWCWACFMLDPHLSSPHRSHAAFQGAAMDEPPSEVSSLPLSQETFSELWNL